MKAVQDGLYQRSNCRGTPEACVRAGGQATWVGCQQGPSLTISCLAEASLSTANSPAVCFLKSSGDRKDILSKGVLERRGGDSHQEARAGEGALFGSEVRGGAVGWARSNPSVGTKLTRAPSSEKNKGDGKERSERWARREPVATLAQLEAHRGLLPTPGGSQHLWGGTCWAYWSRDATRAFQTHQPPRPSRGARAVPPPPGSLTWDLLCGLLPRLVGAAPSLGQKGRRTAMEDKRVTRSGAGHIPASTGSTSRHAIRGLALHCSPRSPLAVATWRPRSRPSRPERTVRME